MLQVQRLWPCGADKDKSCVLAACVPRCVINLRPLAEACWLAADPAKGTSLKLVCC